MALTTGGIPAQIQTEIKRMWFTNKNLSGTTLLTGTNYLQDGYHVCLDPVNTGHTDGTSTAAKGYCVTKPQTRNLMMYAGVVTNVPRNFQGPGWVDVIVKSSGDIPSLIKADLTGAATTSVILTPVDGEWSLAAIGNMSASAAGNVLVRASVAVATSNGTDSSSTAASQNATILPTCAI